MSNKNKSTLQQQIDGMQKERMPERDLWPGIEHALIHKSDLSLDEVSNINSKKMMFKPVYALAASVTLVAFVGYFSFQSGVVTTSEGLAQQLNEQHIQQRESLLASLKDQPTTTENWQQQLNELDEAAAAIRKALENEPNNAALLRMLKRVHQQQIALIERVHAPAWQQI